MVKVVGKPPHRGKSGRSGGCPGGRSGHPGGSQTAAMTEASGFESLARSLGGSRRMGRLQTRSSRRSSCRPTRPSCIFPQRGQFKPGHHADRRHDQPGSQSSACRSGQAVHPGQRHRANPAAFRRRAVRPLHWPRRRGLTWRTRRMGKRCAVVPGLATIGQPPIQARHVRQQGHNHQVHQDHQSYQNGPPGGEQNSTAGFWTADGSRQPMPRPASLRDEARPMATAPPSKPATSRANRAQCPATARFHCWPAVFLLCPP